MKLRKSAVPLDQIIFAVPAAAFIATPLIDMFLRFYNTITGSNDWTSFRMIPYLPPI